MKKQVCLFTILAGSLVMAAQDDPKTAATDTVTADKAVKQIISKVTPATPPFSTLLVSRAATARSRPASPAREFRTSVDGVTYELRSDGAVNFRCYSSEPFRGVAITPDGRNLYIGN